MCNLQIVEVNYIDRKKRGKERHLEWGKMWKVRKKMKEKKEKEGEKETRGRKKEKEKKSEEAKKQKGKKSMGGLNPGRRH